METLHSTEAAEAALSSAPLSPEQDVPDTNPLAESGGRFQDDPFWDEMLKSIRQHRREMDAEWDTPE